MPLIWGWDQLRQIGTTGKSIFVGSGRERFVKAGQKGEEDDDEPRGEGLVAREIKLEASANVYRERQAQQCPLQSFSA
jgi:hypothetical protein